MREAGTDTWDGVFQSWPMRLCAGCELEHDRQATEWGEAEYEVYFAARESGRTFNSETVRWELAP